MKPFILVYALSFTTSASAAPQPTKAEQLFARARQLLTAGKVAEACTTFDEAQQAAPSIATELNQASCREDNGQLATAWRLFSATDQHTRGATDDSTRELHNVANFHAHRLEPRLSRLTIAVPDGNRVPGLAIVIDGMAVEADAWNTGLPVDGGTVKVWARARHHVEWSTTLTIATERAAKTVTIPLLASER